MTRPPTAPAGAGAAAPTPLDVTQLDLPALVALEADALLLWLPQRTGPLAGVAGLADFALAGRLSRAQQAGRVTFAAGERVLVPAAPALRVPRVLCTGLGEPRALDAAAMGELLEAAVGAARAAGAQTLAAGLPALGLGASARAQQTLAALVLRAAAASGRAAGVRWVRA